MHFIKTIVLLFISSGLFAQQNIISILDSGHKTSLRGLSVVTDNVLWASGSNGTVVRSTNGGKSFEWLTVKGYEQRDFRDVEAFDANTALIMAIAEPAIILKTKDGGKNWYKVFEDTTKGMFLDAMDFADNKHGVVIGDPINTYLFLASTEDGGEDWKVVDTYSHGYQVYEGEAFFASSGTNIKLLWDSTISMADGLYVSGGKKSRLFANTASNELPIMQGKESTGANSIAFNDSAKMGVVVGGDFKNDKEITKSCVLLNLKDSIHFSKPQTPPHGYRSCVAYITEKKLITCGTSGVDISTDGGMNWELISTQSFHVCQKAKKGTTVFLAGVNGKIAKLVK